MCVSFLKQFMIKHKYNFVMYSVVNIYEILSHFPTKDAKCETLKASIDFIISCIFLFSKDSIKIISIVSILFFQTKAK